MKNLDLTEDQISLLIKVLGDQIKDLESWNMNDEFDVDLEPYRYLQTKLAEYHFFKYEYR
jgi:hypothetical protein